MTANKTAKNDLPVLDLIAQAMHPDFQNHNLVPVDKIKLARVEKAYQNLFERQDLGYLKLPLAKGSNKSTSKNEPITGPSSKELPSEWAQIQEFSKKYSKFNTLAIIGIGGSTVGTEAVLKALRPELSSLVIFDTPYEHDVIRKLKGLDLKTTLFFIVSKSGNTLETLFCADLVFKAFESSGLNFYSNALVATEEKSSPLYNWAVAHSIPNLPVPKDVGGRFSVLTSVGLFPFAFFNLDLPSLCHGALQAHENKALLFTVAARILDGLDHHESLTYFWFYFNELNLFKTWVHQLWAESLGKSMNKNGQACFASVPFVALGPQDQHSIQQQVLDGQFKKSCLFFREASRPGLLFIESSQFENSFWQNKSGHEIIRCQSEATFQACANKQIPSLLFEVKGINEESIGYLVHFFQLLVGVLGEALEINAFDQPAVETGKILTKELLTKRPESV